VDPRRVIVGHCDTVPDTGYHLELAAAGCFVEIDTIGTGTEHDLRRGVEYTLNLVAAGYEERVLLSHDIFLRSHMTADGGCGYAFLITDFLPRLREAGLSEQQLRLFTVDNPRAALTGERVAAP
jgi:phosphotriesterase-related protein